MFGSNIWRTSILGATANERVEEAIRVLGIGIKARWTTPVVRMVTGRTATRYLLVHFTNSDDGRDLMKSCQWSLFPDGDFRVRSTSDPWQPLLFELEANMAPVREWALAKLKERPTRWSELHAAVRAEDWLETHVNEVVKQLKKEGRIAADPVPEGRKRARSRSLRIRFFDWPVEGLRRGNVRRRQTLASAARLDRFRYLAMLPPDDYARAAHEADAHIQMVIANVALLSGEARVTGEIVRVFRGAAALHGTAASLWVACDRPEDWAPEGLGRVPTESLRAGRVIEAYMKATPDGYEVVLDLCVIIDHPSEVPQLPDYVGGPSIT